MIVLGVNSAYHESSACVLRDGQVLSAVEEERFNRVKHGKKARVDNSDLLPEAAMDYCLAAARVGWEAIDHIAYSFDPEERLRRNLGLPSQGIASGDFGTERGERAFHAANLRARQKLLARAAKAEFHFVRHHLCHASSAFYASPFEESCVIAVDGIAEYATTWLGYGKGGQLVCLKEIDFPNSLGFLWEKFSELLGFDLYSGPGKLMGYSATTHPVGLTGIDYHARLREAVSLEPMGFRLDDRVFRFRTHDFEGMRPLFGPKRPAVVHRYEEAAIASALQATTEEILAHLARELHACAARELGHPVANLSLAGGVALNCLANRAILDQTPFERLFVQPAANDAGTALGAALWVWHQRLGNETRAWEMKHAFLGPSYSEREMEESLKVRAVSYTRPDNLERAVARLLYEGEIVARFDGAMELGPRALGNRSILADPTRFDMREILNTRVKYRESFRPFAPSVLDSCMSDLFEGWRPVPADETMLLVHRTRGREHMRIPAVVQEDECRHVNTSRAQLVTRAASPSYYRLIDEFRALSGVGAVLNTSFNLQEPIVCSPDDAVRTFLGTRIDALALGPFLARRG
jgi:carbamoyltransferase